jgi:hypothetical protein
MGDLYWCFCADHHRHRVLQPAEKSTRLTAINT